MKNGILSFLFVLCSLSSIHAGFPALDSVGRIPDSMGLSGAFVGKLGDRILFIGGANFAKGYPWEGGMKIFYDQIYVIQQEHTACRCKESELKFPVRIAQGFAVSCANSIYCLGGLTEGGESKVVYRVSFNKEKVLEVDKFTELPVSFHAVGAVSLGSKIFVPGYSGNSPKMYMLDLHTRIWSLAAPYPGQIRQEGVIVNAQTEGRNKRLFMMGGRAMVNGKLVLHSDVLLYNPKTNQWKNMGPIKIMSEDGIFRPKTLMAAPSLPISSDHILVFGGDDGVEFEKRFNLDAQISVASDAVIRDSLRKVLAERFLCHPGFSKALFLYNIRQNTGLVLSEYTVGLPVVTTAVRLKGKILIISGEVKPAVRSPKILQWSEKALRKKIMKMGL